LAESNKQYRTVIGFVQFDPREGNAAGKDVRNIAVRATGFKEQAIRVSATLWPSHADVAVEKDDLVAIEGSYTQTKGEKDDGTPVTYHNMSVSRIAVLGKGNSGVKVEVENETRRDEPATTRSRSRMPRFRPSTRTCRPFTISRSQAVGRHAYSSEGDLERRRGDRGSHRHPRDERRPGSRGTEQRAARTPRSRTCRPPLTRNINDQVADYRGLVEPIAAALANSKKARRVGAEYDDLIQEGLIMVWQLLERRITPTAVPVKNRMIDYIRLLAHQTGFALRECQVDPDTEEFIDHDPVTGEYVGPCSQHIPYEALLPMDDYASRPLGGAG
jgi:hypothetical protein